MIDAFDYLTKTIILAISASYYHIVYWSLDGMKKEIDRFYYIIRSPMVLMAYVLIARVINIDGSGMFGILNLLVFYSMVTYTIMDLGKDSRYLLLGVSTSLFLSEYWEIPIYLWQVFFNGTYAGYNYQQCAYLIGRFLIKISTVWYMMINITELGLNRKRFMKHLIIFSFVYIPIVILWFLFGTQQINWIFRVSCFIMVLQYLYKEGIEIIH